MNTLSKSRYWLFVVILIFFSPALLFADGMYTGIGIDPWKPNFGTDYNENIDPNEGGLTLVYTDLTLPGNGGLDLEINRVYNSKSVYNANQYIDAGESLLGSYGWSIHFGRIKGVNPMGLPDYSNVKIEMFDGSTHYAFKIPNSPNPDVFRTKEHWKMTWAADNKSLLLDDGTEYIFNQRAGTFYYATQINKNGNSINIFYRTENGKEHCIDYVEDSLGRTIDFRIETVKVVSAGGSNSYDIDVLTGIWYCDTPIGSVCPDSGETTKISYAYKKHDPLGNSANPPYMLSEVIPLEGNSWYYDYDGSHYPYRELAAVTTPGEAEVTYYFDTVYRGLKYLPGFHEFRALQQKTYKERGCSQYDTWTISYTQDDDWDITEINDPCNRITHYTTYGYGSPLVGECWKFGLLNSMEISEEGSIELREEYEWARSSGFVSEKNHRIPFVCKDYEIYVPLMTKKEITRDGKTYTTEFSDFDEYGNPGTIVETGDTTRTTDFSSYWYNQDKNIITGRPVGETVTGLGGSFATTYQYNTNGQVTRVNRFGVTTSHAYYANGNLEKTTDANNHVTRFTWAWGNISNEENEEYTIIRNINKNGTVASKTSGRGYTTFFEYDKNLRLKKMEPPTGNPVIFEYADNYSLARRQRGGNYTDYYFDGLGRPTGSLDRAGIESFIVYNACGFKEYTDSNVGDKIYYDSFGRITLIRHKDGTQKNYTYNNSNVTVTDENYVGTGYFYTAFGDPDDTLLTQVTDAYNNTTTYDYNILGSLTGIQHGTVLAREFEYNTKNFLISESHADRGNITYTRDNVGNIKSRIDGKGTIDFTYDGINRIKYIDYGEEGVAYTYAGHMLQNVNNAITSITYNYDSADRLKQTDETIFETTYSTDYQYDNNDNIKVIIYPSGREINYTYNILNQVTKVAWAGGYVENVQYYTTGAKTGLLKSFEYSNGVKTEFDYNARNLMKSLGSGTTSSNRILSLDYTYDTRGNLKTVTDLLDSTKNTNFTYDNLNRLKVFGGPWGNGRFEYDSVGNRTAKQVGGSTVNYSYNINNRLTSITGSNPRNYYYNSDGDIITINGLGSDDHLLEWDQLHRLVSYDDQQEPRVNFSYNGNGQRVLKEPEGERPHTIYQYDQADKIITEMSENQDVVDYVYLNGLLAAKIVTSVSFTADTTAGPQPLTVQFNNTSSGDWTSFSWDFGDNTTSTEEAPGHTYTTPGVYSVTLTAFKGENFDSITKTDYITVNQETFRADFDADNDCDGGDLLVICGEFGRTDCNENPCDSDLNNDGNVNNDDLILFSEDYGRVI